MHPMERADRYVIGRERNAVLVDSARRPNPPSPIFRAQLLQGINANESEFTGVPGYPVRCVAGSRQLARGGRHSCAARSPWRQRSAGAPSKTIKS